jgi:hypothetical protein
VSDGWGLSVLALAKFCAVVEFEALCVGVNVYVVHKLKQYFADVPDPRVSMASSPCLRCGGKNCSLGGLASRYNSTAMMLTGGRSSRVPISSYLTSVNVAFLESRSRYLVARSVSPKSVIKGVLYAGYQSVAKPITTLASLISVFT